GYGAVSGAECRVAFRCHSQPGSCIAAEPEPRLAAGAGANYQQVPGEKSRRTLPARIGHSLGSPAPEARHGFRTSPVAKAAGKRWTVMALAGIAAIALLAIGYLHFQRTPKLTDKDRIILADFRNMTGDSVFDGTLRRGLAVQLGGAPFLSLGSDERRQHTLRLVGLSADAPLTPALAREICERTGSAAVLEGSIARFGSEYVLGLRGQNCRTGEVVDEEQLEAARKEDVLNALSQI